MELGLLMLMVMVLFTPFPRLPPELRLRIWNMASFRNPRNISIGKHMVSSWQYDEGVRVMREDLGENFGHKCKSTMATALQTCKEARVEGLKHYKLIEWVPEVHKEWGPHPGTPFLDAQRAS